MSTVPNDPFMLLSFLNTQLRDNYSNLTELCHAFSLNEEEINRKMKTIDYAYNQSRNQFV